MFGYYCIFRPPQYGAVPDGYDPDQSTFNFPPVKEMHGPNEIRHYGLLQYPNRLTFQKVWSFELRIANLPELALYTIWNREREDTEFIIDDYANQEIEWINQMIDAESFDSNLIPMKIILEFSATNGWSKNQLSAWVKEMIS